MLIVFQLSQTKYGTNFTNNVSMSEILNLIKNWIQINVNQKRTVHEHIIYQQCIFNIKKSLF